jgi:hypothetical protein
VTIKAVPVEAYRQANDYSATKSEAGKKEKLDPKKTSQSDRITLPGVNDAQVASIKLEKPQSLLSGILSSEERDLLVKYFARFGDAPESSQIYGTDAWATSASETGLKVDLKG